MKIVFAGTPEFAASSLQALLDLTNQRPNDIEIVGVYTQPDRPAGRGKKILKSEVKQLAENNNLPIFQPLNFKESEARDELTALNADLMIVAAYGLLLPQSILDTPRLGCINVHASLLPRWRGAAPIQRAIQKGDQETGITIMKMALGLDTGDMLLKTVTPILTDETGGSLHDKLAIAGGETLIRFIETLLNNDESLPQGEIQDEALTCYAHKLSKQEAEIDWTLPATKIEALIRAFNPWPVCYTETQGQRVRIFDATIEPSKASSPFGSIIEKTKEGVLIACAESSCGNNALRIKSLQLPGAKRISAEQFFNGGKNLLNAGDQLSQPNTSLLRDSVS